MEKKIGLDSIHSEDPQLFFYAFSPWGSFFFFSAPKGWSKIQSYNTPPSLVRQIHVDEKPLKIFQALPGRVKQHVKYEKKTGLTFHYTLVV